MSDERLTAPLFTVEEANACLPRLNMLMEQLQRHTMTLRAHIQDVAQRTGRPPEEVAQPGVLRHHPELRPILTAISTVVNDIEDGGVLFKGIELGLVDFPAEIEGEVVLLCWQYGEPEIRYYHRIGDGFQGRKPLPDVPKPSAPVLH